MNPRVLPLVALFAAVAACVYFFLVRENAASIGPPPPASAVTGASADQRASGMSWDCLVAGMALAEFEKLKPLAQP